MAIEDYFSLFEIPFSLQPDAAVVKRQFYQLSKQFHPDKFSMAEADAQEKALQQTALINQAYKTFSNPDSLLGYVLKKAGILEEEESYALPQDFLMEMMDMNEAVSDYEMQPDNEAAKSSVQQAFSEHWAALEKQLNETGKSLTSWADVGEKAVVLKDLFYRRKYLLRIKQRIDTFAAPPEKA